MNKLTALGCATTLALVLAVAGAVPAAAQDEPPVLDGPASVSAPAFDNDLLPREPDFLLTAPKYGPCTMTYQCSSACGGKFISCSGQDYCQMGSDIWNGGLCRRNIWVQCDDQPPVKCIDPLIP